MPRFYFHLWDGEEWLADPEGMRLSDSAMAIDASLRQARDVMAGDVLRGWLDMNCRIAVNDDKGETIHMLAFADCITVAPAAIAAPAAMPRAMRITKVLATPPDPTR